MANVINIDGLKVGDDHPAITIAEAAVEHLGSVEVAKRMVDAAQDAGADFIKFQMHLPDSEMIPDSIHFWGGSLDEVLERYNLTNENHVELMAYCKKQGMRYLCTPFCAAAADVLNKMGVTSFKIGSGEMTNIPMLQHIARMGKPMMISTGMATVTEVEETVAMLKKEGAQYILLNCTSIYPAPYSAINLGQIPIMKEKYGVNIGHSDHTPDIWTALGAVVKGAKVIEKHFTLDRRMKGPDYEVSLEPQDFKMMVDAIKKIEAAMGSESKVYPEEEVTRNWAHHSVVSVKNIPAGSVITREMVDVKRPGSGIPAKQLMEVVGSVAKKEIPTNSILKWEQLTPRSTLGART